MTFLDLCKRLRQEAGISGSGPASVLERSGIEKQLVDWIAAAWAEVQGEHTDWAFNYNDFEFRTEAGKRIYEPGEIAGLMDMSRWEKHSLSFYLETAGRIDERPLEVISYREFRSRYDMGVPTQDRPQHAAICPLNCLQLGPTPEAVYVVRGEYYRAPQTLAANSDIPRLPERYHLAIVWRALMLYAASEESQALFQGAQINYSTLLGQMVRDQLPQFSANPGPLV